MSQVEKLDESPEIIDRYFHVLRCVFFSRSVLSFFGGAEWSHYLRTFCFLTLKKGAEMCVCISQDVFTKIFYLRTFL